MAPVSEEERRRRCIILGICEDGMTPEMALAQELVEARLVGSGVAAVLSGEGHLGGGADEVGPGDRVVHRVHDEQLAGAAHRGERGAEQRAVADQAKT